MANVIFTTKRNDSSIPDKPADDRASDQNLSKDDTTRVSFRDKVMGNKKVPPPMPKMDLITQELMTKVFQKLCEPWKDALGVTLLEKNVEYMIMNDRFQQLWKSQGGFDLLGVDNGYYMLKFDLQSDQDRVISGGPWLIFYHYLCVFNWTPEFASSTTKIQKSMICVQFPGRSVLYYNGNVLLGIAFVIDKPIKVDRNTLNCERGHFAQICVDIDRSLPVVGKFWLNDHWYKIEYEGLHLICSRYGYCGHLSRNCTAEQGVVPLVSFGSQGGVAQQILPVANERLVSAKGEGSKVNPDDLENQVHGGMTYGVSQEKATTEEGY